MLTTPPADQRAGRPRTPEEEGAGLQGSTPTTQEERVAPSTPRKISTDEALGKSPILGKLIRGEGWGVQHAKLQRFFSDRCNFLVLQDDIFLRIIALS